MSQQSNAKYIDPARAEVTGAQLIGQFFSLACVVGRKYFEMTKMPDTKTTHVMAAPRVPSGARAPDSGDSAA
jgi:hypothetical protein